MYAPPIDLNPIEAMIDQLRGAMEGDNPPADWATSFDLRGRDWPTLQAELRAAYGACMSLIEQQRRTPIADWSGLHVAGLCATVGHAAYHLCAICQIAIVAAAGE